MANEEKDTTVKKKNQGSECFAINCNNYQLVEGLEKNLSFHRFPDQKKHPDLHRQWVRNCRRADQAPSSSSVVCSEHFKPSMLESFSGYSRRKTVRLVSGAVPTLFELPEHLQKKTPDRTTETSKRACSQDTSSSSTSPESTSDSQPVAAPSVSSVSYLGDEHSYCITSPSKLKRRHQELLDTVDKLQRDKNNAIRREKRAKLTCQTYISQLEKANLMNAELREKLDSYKHIDADLFRKPASSYTQQQRDFSLTLYLYSPKAYEFLRPHLNLPAVRTISRWLEKFDAEPGIQAAMLQGLKEKHEKDPSNYTDCGIMIDAMAVRKHVSYDPRTRRKIGFTDFGFGEPSEELAKEALVIMVVGYRCNWKAPVAYFLTNGITAEHQGQLLLSAIYACRDIGLRVRTLTFDGAACNVAMVKDFGCKIDPTESEMKVHFLTPDGASDRIYLIFDACHMLKLLRNCLHDLDIIISPKGPITFDTLKSLKNLQDDVGLHLANKLSNKHIQYQNLKMKVCLAAQTLSESVCRALETAYSIGVPGFEDCLALAEFCLMTNNAFDILNSRTSTRVGYKKSCRLQDLPELKERCAQIRDYFSSLTNQKGRPLVNTARKTGFVGFMVSLESLQQLLPEILGPKTVMDLNYFRTYTVSQDHLELFFNAVRRCGGWNTNPNVYQFKGAFRKLIARAGASTSGTTGNCVALEHTELVRAATSSYLPPDNLRPEDENDERDTFSAVNINSFNRIFDDSGAPDPLKHGLVVDNILVYVAGFVVRKAVRRISCVDCASQMVSSEVTDNKISYLLTFKDHGGLFVPSKSVIKLITVCERVLRSMSGVRKLSREVLLKHKFMSTVLEVCGALDLFDQEHERETRVGIDNHSLCMIKIMASVFYELRLCHISRLENSDLRKVSIRNKSHRNVIFLGQ